MTTKPLKLWCLDPATGTWHPAPTQAKDLQVEANRCNAAQAEAGLPEVVFRAAWRRPNKRMPFRRMDRLPAGLLPSPVPAAQPTGTALTKTVNPAPLQSIISTHDQRAKWGRREAFKLARQHHRMDAEETYELLVSIGIDPMGVMLGVPLGPFYDALDAGVVHIVGASGTFIIRTDKAGIKIDGRNIDAIDFMASGEFAYDLRFLTGRKSDHTKVPDDKFVGGLELVKTVEGIEVERDAATPGALIQALEQAIGIAIVRPDPVRKLQLRAKRMDDATETCDCKDCVKARELAKEHGTKPADERRKIDEEKQAKGPVPPSAPGPTPPAGPLPPPQDPVDPRMLKKIEEAQKRGSRLHVPEKQTVN